MDDLQLGTRQQLSIVLPEDKNLQPITVYGGAYYPGYTPNLPARDSDAMGGVRCAHCLLLPAGMSDAHEILAVAHPDQKPQRAWFYVDRLQALSRFPHPGGFGNWEITGGRAKLKLVTGDTIIWKLTDLFAGPALQLGVWVD
jgi:hypothetical protein